jgi:hypothetical protein
MNNKSVLIAGSKDVDKRIFAITVSVKFPNEYVYFFKISSSSSSHPSPFIPEEYK